MTRFPGGADLRHCASQDRNRSRGYVKMAAVSCVVNADL
jgi:hypothetical protein